MPTRTDPPVSEAQRRAMWAASEGRGNLDIPKSVGKEFAEADPGGKLPEHAKKADAAPNTNAFGSGASRSDAASSHLRTHADCAADGLRGHPTMRGDEHMGFENLERSLAARKDDEAVHDPAALAAWIGRKKYGKEEFQHKAAEGRKKD